MEIIDTKEKFEEWEAEIEDCDYHYFDNSQYKQLICSNFPWWAKREALRITNGIYRSTDVTHRINKYFPVYAHVSQSDPAMIAFTPDATCGEKDKQIKTTVGRLVQKLLPTASQEFIQRWVDEHNSEINMEISFASKQEITDIYINHGRSGGCMSKSHFDNSNHPTLVYHTDKIRMAYVKAGDTITHRSMVYEDGEDKRFIRCYPPGDTGFKRKLIEMGYKKGSWLGAELKLITLPNNDRFSTRFILPYLDANDGFADVDHSTVAIVDGKLVVINRHQQQLLSSHQYRTATGTEGVATVEPIKSDSFNSICGISGKTFNMFTDQSIVTHEYLDDDGEIKQALGSEIPEDYLLVPTILSSLKYVYAKPENTITVLDNYLSHTLVAATKRHIEECGFVPLTTARWINTPYVRRHMTIELDGKFYLKEEVVLIVHYKDKQQTNKYVLSKDFKPKSYYKAHCGRYITKDSDYLVTTSGKKVIPGLDDYYTLVNGDIVLRRPKYCAYVYGKSYWFNNPAEKTAWLQTKPKELAQVYFDNLEKDFFKYIHEIRYYVDTYSAYDSLRNKTYKELLQSHLIQAYSTPTVKEVVKEKLEALEQASLQQEPQPI